MNKHLSYTHLAPLILLLAIMGCKKTLAQYAEVNPYLPTAFTSEGWKIKADVFADQWSASSTFSGAFIKQVNQSGKLSSDLINAQFKNFRGSNFMASRQHIGAGVWLNSKKQKSPFFYYFGLEHQYLMDAQLDDDLLRVLFKGNAPYAGQTLNFSSSQYSSIYFNQLKAGIGIAKKHGGIDHTFISKYSINFGQNYSDLQIQNSSLFTHPDGDYLNIDFEASMQLSDTVWAEVTDVNGMGFSADLFYSLSKEDDYYFSVELRNLGFITWNKNTFSATTDTAFVFEGSLNDSLMSGQNLPDNYSYNSLRDFIFTENNPRSFSKPLPVSISLSGGKYFADGKYYLGIRGNLFRISQPVYSLELFATWNPNAVISFTPLLSYNNLSGPDFGLALSTRIADHILMMAGVSGVNSVIHEDALAGSGGFVRLIFYR